MILKTRDIQALFLLAALWGASFLFIRVTAPALGPVIMVELRVLLAVMLLVVYATLTRQSIEIRSKWRQFLILGAINSVVPFILIATAELTLTASLGAILNATTPLFSAIIAALWGNDRFTLKNLVGLLLGLAGVTIVVGWNPLAINITVILSALAVLLGSLSYGLGSVYAKLAFKASSPLSLAIGQQLAAGIILTPVAVINLPQKWPPLEVVLCLMGLAFFSTAIAYLLYFRLIASAGPTNTTSVTLLVPIFGITWGAIFLGEPLGLGVVVGFGVILVSLFLVTGFKLPLPGLGNRTVTTSEAQVPTKNPN